MSTIAVITGLFSRSSASSPMLDASGPRPEAAAAGARALGGAGTVRSRADPDRVRAAARRRAPRRPARPPTRVTSPATPAPPRRRPPPRTGRSPSALRVDQVAAGRRRAGWPPGSRPGCRCRGRCRGSGPPPARPAASAGRHTARTRSTGPAGRPRDQPPGQQREAGEAVAAELPGAAGSAAGRPSRRTVCAVPAVEQRGQVRAPGRRRSARYASALPTSTRPAGDPVPQVGRRRRRCRAGAPGSTERWARSPTWATTWSAEVAGVHRDPAGPARPSAGQPGQRPVQQRHVADRAQRLGQPSRSAGAAGCPRRRRAPPRTAAGRQPCRSGIVGHSGGVPAYGPMP